MIRTVTCAAFAAVCLTSLAAAPNAQAQNAYGDAYGPWYAAPGYTHYGPPYPRRIEPHQANINEEFGEGTAGPNVQGQTPGTYAPNIYGNGYYTNTPGGYGGTRPAGGYTMAPSTAGTSTTEVITNGPQGSPPPGWSPQRNIQESRHYTWLLEHNRAFREARMRKECSPITDPRLHENCLQSFAEYSPWQGTAPAYGSSNVNEGYGTYSGR